MFIQMFPVALQSHLTSYIYFSDGDRVVPYHRTSPSRSLRVVTTDNKFTGTLNIAYKRYFCFQRQAPPCTNSNIINTSGIWSVNSKHLLFGLNNQTLDIKARKILQICHY